MAYENLLRWMVASCVRSVWVVFGLVFSLRYPFFDERRIAKTRYRHRWLPTNDVAVPF
jgi:hypothetical protein